MDKNITESQKLSKKLKGVAWSQWGLDYSSGESLNTVIRCFDKLDENEKVRALIAIISLEVNKKNSLVSPIKQLLSKASNDEDMWVKIIAGLIHQNLYDTNDVDIESKAINMMKESSESIVNKVMNVLNNTTNDLNDGNNGNYSNYITTAMNFFQPYEDKLFHKIHSTSTHDNNNSSNSSSSINQDMHFKFIGSRPKLFARKEQLESKNARVVLPGYFEDDNNNTTTTTKIREKNASSLSETFVPKQKPQKSRSINVLTEEINPHAKKQKK